MDFVQQILHEVLGSKKKKSRKGHLNWKIKDVKIAKPPVKKPVAKPAAKVPVKKATAKPLVKKPTIKKKTVAKLFLPID